MQHNRYGLYLYRGGCNISNCLYVLYYSWVETKIGTKLIKRFTGLGDVSAIHMETVDISYMIYLKYKKIYKIYIGQDKQNFECKNVNIFLSSNLNICFGCSKEPSQWDGSFEYPQHMFWLINKKIYFMHLKINHALLSSGQSWYRAYQMFHRAQGCQYHTHGDG